MQAKPETITWYQGAITHGKVDQAETTGMALVGRAIKSAGPECASTAEAQGRKNGELLTCQLVSAGRAVMLIRKAVRLGRGAVRSWK
jgi:hypothetical protein